MGAFGYVLRISRYLSDPVLSRRVCGPYCSKGRGIVGKIEVLVYRYLMCMKEDCARRMHRGYTLTPNGVSNAVNESRM